MWRVVLVGLLLAGCGGGGQTGYSDRELAAAKFCEGAVERALDNPLVAVQAGSVRRGGGAFEVYVYTARIRPDDQVATSQELCLARGGGKDFELTRPLSLRETYPW